MGEVERKPLDSLRKTGHYTVIPKHDADWRNNSMQKQRKHKTFRVRYQTEHGKGCIMIYVGSFFGRNRLNDAIPFLRFARLHCTREQQLALLAILEEEKLLHRDTERERIEKTIKKIEAQTWGQSDKGKVAKSAKAGKSGNTRKRKQP